MSLKTRGALVFYDGQGEGGRIEFDRATSKLSFKLGGVVVGTIKSTKQLVIPALNAKAGATAGWVITGGTNLSLATLPASQTGSTLVVPITGLEVGDTITAVAAVGQIDSAGNNVTCVMSLRKITSAAASGHTDAQIATANVGTLTADTLLTDDNGNLKVSAQTEVLAADEQIYALLTATTGATTDIEISHFVVSVTKG